MLKIVMRQLRHQPRRKVKLNVMPRLQCLFVDEKPSSIHDNRYSSCSDIFIIKRVRTALEFIPHK